MHISDDQSKKQSHWDLQNLINEFENGLVCEKGGRMIDTLLVAADGEAKKETKWTSKKRRWSETLTVKLKNLG